jgi:4-amino-4-deoxy-L-arabinose transferase-like glycosyltransferase/GT2 family glycosyltransferase
MVKWPSVSVVIPVKANQATISTTVNSLLEQDYEGQVEILLVGDKGDRTWEPIHAAIAAGKVRIIEAEIVSSNRDANEKRRIGMAAAKGEVLALTDGDMALPSNWISTGLQYILRGWPCVGGPMRGVSGTFWDAYADLVTLGSKTPRFVVNRVVDAGRFGLPQHKPPITANVFMTRDALRSAGEFDPSFVHSYEDYSWFWAACKAGVPILCTPTLLAYHYHRQGWKRLIRQYIRAGKGCSDFIIKYPESPFSRIRLGQWLLVGVVSLGVLGALVAGVLATLNPQGFHLPASYVRTSFAPLPLDVLDPLLLSTFASASLLGLGISNALKVRQMRAIVFPFITLVVGLAFASGMTVEFLSKAWTTTERRVTFGYAQAITAVMFSGVLITSAVIRLWNIGTRPGYEWDEPVYTSVASHFAQYGLIEFKAPIGTVSAYLSHPPFYFIFLGAWFRLFGSGIAQARILAVMMSLIMLTVLFIYLHQRMGRWALLPTLLVAVDGWVVFENRVSWIDNTEVVLGLLSIWAYFHALKTNKTRAYVVAGAALGFALVFKQLGIYFCAVPLLNWILSRRRIRGHLVLLGVVGAEALVYVAAMSLLYRGLFWNQTLDQVLRSLGSVTSRGVVSSPREVIAAVAGQYRIYSFTVLLCSVSLLWLAVDIVRSLRRKDGSWLRRYSIEVSWIVAGVAVFIAIQIKFPNYFVYLMIPLLIYLGMRLRDVASGWLTTQVRHPKLLRVGLVFVLSLALVCDLSESYFRIVRQTDNALLQVAEFASSQIPSRDVVLADQPVGVMIPQRYCELEAAKTCPHVKWIITYTSLTQKLPSQVTDPQLYVYLADARLVTVFRGFKETIRVYQLGSG